MVKWRRANFLHPRVCRTQLVWGGKQFQKYKCIELAAMFVSLLHWRRREAERDRCKPVVTASICSSVNRWIRLPWSPVVGRIRADALSNQKRGASESVEELKGFISPNHCVYISPYTKAWLLIQGCNGQGKHVSFDKVLWSEMLISFAAGKRGASSSSFCEACSLNVIRYLNVSSVIGLSWSQCQIQCGKHHHEPTYHLIVKWISYTDIVEE